jgi:anti-sigma regulatory factor (Ser/Thr protein kinase)
MDEQPAPDPRAEPDGTIFTAELSLPLRDGAARRARQIVHGVLVGWGHGEPDFSYYAQLVASELVTNAVQHGGDYVALELRLTTTSLVVAVRDGSAVLPMARAVEDDEEQGRGMGIVVALAVDWGSEQTPDGGKRVWAELALPRDG